MLPPATQARMPCTLTQGYVTRCPRHTVAVRVQLTECARLWGPGPYANLYQLQLQEPEHLILVSFFLYVGMLPRFP